MSHKIKKILVPLDGSDNSLRGLEEAISIAQPTGATITGLHVVHVPVRSVIHFTPQRRKKEISYAESIIGRATEKAKRNHVGFKPQTATGNAGEKIVQIAKDGRYDMIIMGSRGKSSGMEMFLGSVSNHVLHKSKIPTLIVK
jgi:nucleotide-binding universal stress UspA family protein